MARRALKYKELDSILDDAMQGTIAQITTGEATDDEDGIGPMIERTLGIEENAYLRVTMGVGGHPMAGATLALGIMLGRGIERKLTEQGADDLQAIFDLPSADEPEADPDA